jgi:7-keto-8-aminopelargonate synthetase-like enzyme
MKKIMMNKYQNLKKMIEISEPSWDIASRDGLVDLPVKYLEGPYLGVGDKRFINMCSCSYLGWDRHPAILEGAIKGIRDAGSLHLTTARCRLFLELLGQFEERLSAHFQATAVAYNSCAAASSATLPLLASGALTEGVKPVIAFDKFAHFSMAHMKALCADETEIVTIENNDMQKLEELCNSYPQVAYVSDATNSINGFADIDALVSLQNRYGLFIYLDDSHGLSVTSEQGRGYALERLGRLNEQTVVVASLAKAFGSAGGVLLSGHPNIKQLVVRYGNAWSQYINSAGIGGGIASLDLHDSDELAQAQYRWRSNLSLLDSRFATINAGMLSPIRVVKLNTPEAAVRAAKKLMDRGYYTSAVFFPVVPRNSAGIRIMPRADLSEEQMLEFCTVFQEVCSDELNIASVA